MGLSVHVMDQKWYQISWLWIFIVLSGCWIVFKMIGQIFENCGIQLGNLYKDAIMLVDLALCEGFG